MAGKISRELLEEVKFSDDPTAWAIQAQGFHYSAEVMYRANTRAMYSAITDSSGRLISTMEANLRRQCHKIACYLLAHSIELSLKAIYCLNGYENVEQFSHYILKLKDHLVEKKVLDDADFDKSSLELASILLEWYGRYHRPRMAKMEEKIKGLYKKSEDPSFLEKKFPIDESSYRKLYGMSGMLIEKLGVPPDSLGYLYFDPF